MAVKEGFWSILGPMADASGECAWRPIATAPTDRRVVIGYSPVSSLMAMGFVNEGGEFEQVDREGRPMGVGFYPHLWFFVPTPEGSCKSASYAVSESTEDNNTNGRTQENPNP